MPAEKYFVRYFENIWSDMYTCLLERLKLLDRDLWQHGDGTAILLRQAVQCIVTNWTRQRVFLEANLYNHGLVEISYMLNEWPGLSCKVTTRECVASIADDNTARRTSNQTRFPILQHKCFIWAKKHKLRSFSCAISPMYLPKLDQHRCRDRVINEVCSTTDMPLLLQVEPASRACVGGIWGWISRKQQVTVASCAMDRFLTTIKLGVMFFIPVGLFYQFMMSAGPTKADLEVPYWTIFAQN